MIGIYRIANKTTNKCYIGQSKNIEKRIYKHLLLLRNNKHYNKHLQSSWIKYGESGFNIEIIEECKEGELSVKEKFWINHFNSLNNGYNKTSGGDGIKIINIPKKL